MGFSAEWQAHLNMSPWLAYFQLLATEMVLIMIIAIIVYTMNTRRLLCVPHEVMNNK